MANWTRAQSGVTPQNQVQKPLPRKNQGDPGLNKPRSHLGLSAFRILATGHRDSISQRGLFLSWQNFPKRTNNRGSLTRRSPHIWDRLRRTHQLTLNSRVGDGGPGWCLLPQRPPRASPLPSPCGLFTNQAFSWVSSKCTHIHPLGVAWVSWAPETFSMCKHSIWKFPKNFQVWGAGGRQVRAALAPFEGTPRRAVSRRTVHPKVRNTGRTPANSGEAGRGALGPGTRSPVGRPAPPGPLPTGGGHRARAVA